MVGRVATHLYGQEINAETYAIAKADLLLKGEGDAADNIVGGPEYSTLANDAFPSHEFDFMLSNPPYGRSWKSDLERIGGKTGLTDPRFLIQHDGDPEYSLITRSSDGQLLFLANMLSKMKHGTPLGSRLAEVHNGSSLFTGDAGQGGEQHPPLDHRERLARSPRRAAAEHVLQHRHRHLHLGADEPKTRPSAREGPAHRCDPLVYAARKNLGKKNCELSEVDIARICETFLAFEETEQSKIFPNAAFGYSKVTIEREGAHGPCGLPMSSGASTGCLFRGAGGGEPGACARGG